MALKLFVGNLPHSISDGELSDFVTEAGFRIESAVVIQDKMTGQSKGFGFVELAEGENLQGAIQALNGKPLGGRPLNVSEARPPARTGFSGPRGGGGGGGGGRGRGGFNKGRRNW